jgi:hypothetical protein
MALRYKDAESANPGKNMGNILSPWGIPQCCSLYRTEFAIFVYKSCATARFAIVLFNFTTNE